MSKNITVIVKKTSPNIGNKGEIVKLSAGYIFNYLIPNDIVEIPSKGKIKHITMFNKIEDNKRENIIINATNTKKQIENINKIQINKKIGNQYYIFGSINEKDILNEILNHTGHKIEKKDIQIPEIKKIGLFPLKIKFLDNTSYNLNLQVVPSNL